MVAESFPISSSGHVLLVQRFLVATDIHLIAPLLETLSLIPTLIIILLFFYPSWSVLLKGTLSSFFSRCPTYSQKALRRMTLTIVVSNIVAATVTVILYTLIKIVCADWIATHISLLLPLGFAVTGLSIATLYALPPEGSTRFTLRTASILGAVQGFCLLPGISRLGITFVAARWLGFSRRRSFEVSFLIAFPLFVMGVVKDALALVRVPALPSTPTLFEWGALVVGALVAFVCFRFVYRCALRGTFKHFAAYMIVPFILSLLIS